MVIFLLIRLTKNKKNALIISIALFIIIPLVLRILKYTDGTGLDDFNENYRKIIILRIDCLIYGIIGACAKFYAYDTWRKYKKHFLFLGLSLIAFTFLYRYHGYKAFFFNVVLATNFESLSTLFLLPY